MVRRKHSSPNLPSVELTPSVGFLDESIKPFDLQDFDRSTVEGIEVSDATWEDVEAARIRSLMVGLGHKVEGAA